MAVVREELILAFLEETTSIANIAVALENEGISSFRFDFAGNGESEGSYRVTEESLMDRLSTDMHEACLQFDKDFRLHDGIAFSFGFQETTSIANIAVALENEGISSFRFDFAGNGESEGTFQYGHYRREADDLHAVVQHFYGANRVPREVMLCSYMLPSIITFLPFVNVSGRYDMKRGIKERLGDDFMQTIKKEGFIDVQNKRGSYRVTEESLMDRLSTDMHEACLQIDKDCRESEGIFEYGNYQKEADDLHAVVEHFSGTSRVASVILGHSKGGDVVLLYASKYHDICTVVNVSGRYDLKKGIGERLGKDCVAYRVTEEKSDGSPKVLTVHGSDDEVIPVDDAVEFSKIITNHKLHIVRGANHCYTSHQAELASVVVDYIKNPALQQDKTTSN
ncbi:hypothetical protein J5N97_000314 [Dioscorea zingiberensis]|uniref:Uncharacterized protein n=1 Tax=Dioscorea zingiberensis TaxID=325984 RepID=A0A9D5H1H1_9LILI|nr:hypothetical protein J5N97_000314 [Dioscorea zingiberensis]